MADGNQGKGQQPAPPLQKLALFSFHSCPEHHSGVAPEKDDRDKRAEQRHSIPPSSQPR